MDNTTPVVSVASALQDVGTAFSEAMTFIAGNPIAMVFIGFSLAGAGIALFRKLRH